MLLTDANVCRELIIDADICPAQMLGGISINLYDPSLRFMVTCVGNRQLRLAVAKIQFVVGYDIKESAVLLSVWFILTLLPVFSNLLRVGKEIKESTTQRSLALFLLFCKLQPVKKTCFQRKIVKALRPLPLILRGQFFKIIISYIVKIRFQSTWKYSRKISASS